MSMLRMRRDEVRQDRAQASDAVVVPGGTRDLDIVEDDAADAARPIGQFDEVTAIFHCHDLRNVLVLGDCFDFRFGQSAHGQAIFIGQHQRVPPRLCANLRHTLKPGARRLTQIKARPTANYPRMHVSPATGLGEQSDTPRRAAHA